MLFINKQKIMLLLNFTIKFFEFIYLFLPSCFIFKFLIIQINCLIISFQLQINCIFNLILLFIIYILILFLKIILLIQL